MTMHKKYVPHTGNFNIPDKPYSSTLPAWATSLMLRLKEHLANVDVPVAYICDNNNFIVLSSDVKAVHRELEKYCDACALIDGSALKQMACLIAGHVVHLLTSDKLELSKSHATYYFDDIAPDLGLFLKAYYYDDATICRFLQHLHDRRLGKTNDPWLG